MKSNTKTNFRKFIALALISSLGLTACTTDGSGPGVKQSFGTLGGAALGGLAGAQVGEGKGKLVATGVGAVLGALAGSSIGKSLDRADQQYMSQSVTQAQSAPIGQTISWDNPESGNSGTITPRRQGTNANGRTCREYEQTIYVQGRAESAIGVACQASDGRWDFQQ